MPWIFTCDCGLDIAGASQEELAAAVRRHVEADHPDVAPPPGRDIAAIAEPAPRSRGPRRGGIDVR